MSSSRRQFLAASGTFAAAPLFAGTVNLALPGGPSERPLTAAFPRKGEMILQRTAAPLLETPMQVFDTGIFTPNDRFFVRWHWTDIPSSIDVETWRLNVRGAVNQQLQLSLAELLALPRVEIAAVNQCSGNSRGLFQPRVAGAQWRHGAMGNAKWMGVRLRDVLNRAGVKAGAVAVRFTGMDKPLMPGAPAFVKSLTIDHALGTEPMLAFAMNGEQLPMLHGFPLRLVVPGWYSTYWVKMLNDIEVLTVPDDGYYMTHAYMVPATPYASVAPGAKGFPTRPISTMVPRAWITSLADGASVPMAPTLAFGGIAMGGDTGVARVDISADGGRSWAAARLGPDAGRHSFRRFDAAVQLAQPGPVSLMARCTNTAGAVQPMVANWNAAGLMRGVVETTAITVA